MESLCPIIDREDEKPENKTIKENQYPTGLICDNYQTSW
jgi:hypothetical protein